MGKIFLIGILLISSSLSDYCGPHCTACIYQNRCELCYNYEMDFESNKCTEKKGTIENCIGYTTDTNGNQKCSLCKKGFATVQETGKCIQHEIQDCIYASSQNGVFYCTLCEDGVQDYKTNLCVKRENLPEGYWKEGCVIGAGFFYEGFPEFLVCLKCEQGTALLKSKKCVSTGYGNCMAYDESRDQCYCDFTQGMIQTGEKKCENFE